MKTQFLCWMCIFETSELLQIWGLVDFPWEEGVDYESYELEVHIGNFIKSLVAL